MKATFLGFYGCNYVRCMQTVATFEHNFHLVKNVSMHKYCGTNMMNKLAKLRRHASRVHFAKIHFG